MIFVLMELSGGIDRGESEGDELPVPGAEHRLPVIPVRGLKREQVVVLGESKSGIERVPVVGYVVRRFVTPIFARPPLEKAEGALHEAVTFRAFCRENPHPATVPSNPRCVQNELACDWARGAESCAFCRDRLAIWETLLAAPAVRAVPAG